MKLRYFSKYWFLIMNCLSINMVLAGADSTSVAPNSAMISQPNLIISSNINLPTGKQGYYCRKTSFNEQSSWDYVGFSPLCPVIQPNQIQGYCSCMQIMLY